MGRTGNRWAGICCIVLVSALPLVSQAVEETNSCLACDREMRKTFESIQAWRRLHNGQYPARLTDLTSAGLLPGGGAICPEVLRESPGATAIHGGFTSRTESGDPAGFYEYEMSARVDQYENDKWGLPDNAKPYTRQDLKSVLLRRPFFEQVPILRCSSHRAEAPGQFAREDTVFRNLSVTGNIYWSGPDWEKLWVADVPYCARGSIVLFGLKGPPFYTDRAPALPQALDLRKWSCAFGDVTWWWTLPMFQSARAADLQPFFQEQHGRAAAVDGADWWLDGLVQLQGRVKQKNETMYDAPGLIGFVWKKTGLPVERKFSRASWLQGTVWTAEPGETAGWLVWHYSDGSQEKIPIVYGQSTARFWAEPSQVAAEKNFPEPVWRFHQDKESVGVERWLRLYRQDWSNPRPDVTVASLDFVSNPACRAAPFLIAVDVFP